MYLTPINSFITKNYNNKSFAALNAPVAFEGQDLKTKVKTVEKTAKLLSSAAAVAGIVSASIASTAAFDGTFFEKPEIHTILKNSLKPYLGREIYVVAKENFIHEPAAFDDYLAYEIRNILLDNGQISDEKVDVLKNAAKEIVIERINNVELPEDFSDIKALNLRGKKVKYSDIILSSDFLRSCVDAGLALKGLPVLTGCTYRQILTKAQLYGITSQRQKEMRYVQVLKGCEEEIKTYVRLGYTVEMLQERYNASAATILKLLKQFCIKTDGQQNIDRLAALMTKDSLLECIQKGMSIKEMARYFKCSNDAVVHKLKNFGLQTEMQKNRS